MPSSTCAPAAVTTMLTTTPTVANTAAGANTLRTSENRVVRPPSTRMIASATVPRCSGEQEVVELQPQPVLADDDADAEEQQQAGQPHPAGHPGGDDAGQQHEPTDQQHQIQLLQAHFIPVRTA